MTALEGEMNASTASTIYWLFGRGVSIECGLTWTVPEEWCHLSREANVDRIRERVRAEMDQVYVSGAPYRQLLELLRHGTQPGWRHQFITTNWDFLLQREILGLGLRYLPKWLHSSHVSHMNGTVEVLADNSNRSPFLLENDPPSQRTWTVEANVTYNEMIWGRHFVVVGISFECNTDRFLLKALGDVSDDLIIGESYWIVLNPDEHALHKVVGTIQRCLPRAKIDPIKKTFLEWLRTKMPELQRLGALLF